MMESTQPQEQALESLLQQGLDGSDKPPADVTAFAEAVFSWRSIDADWAESPLTRSNQEMTPR